MQNMPEHSPAPTPSRAVYGLAMYLSFKTFFVLYVVWAVIPQSWFRYIGITYLPQRYWAVAVPIYIVSAVLLFGFIIYPSINLCMTPDLNDVRTVMDGNIENNGNRKQLFSPTIATLNKCVCKNKDKCSRDKYLKMLSHSNNSCIPVADDLDIIKVSKLLYSRSKFE